MFITELNKIISLSIFGFLIFAYSLSAQPHLYKWDNPNEEHFKVDSIKISGNDKTEDFIILRELTFQPGDTITESQLKYNSERIFSLNLFTKVDVNRDSINKTTVNIKVNESWYIYPIPFIDRADKSNSKYSFGINLLYKNFRGRNENLSTAINFGYDPYFFLMFDNPAMFYYDQIGITAGVSYSNPKNKNITAEYLNGGEFSRRVYSTFLTVYKRLDQFNLVSLSGSFDYIKFSTDKYFLGLSASEKTIDRNLGLTAGYVYDSRDLKQFPQRGIYAGIALTHKGFGIDNTNYNILGVEYKQFEKIFDGLITRWRVAARHAYGRLVPYYAFSYLGYDEYVRGHSDDRREGNNLIVSSFELSYPILDEFNFSIKLPLLPRSLTSARIGIFLTAFTDAGHAFNNNYHFRIKDFYAGYGGGITFLFLPYNALRLEYAVGDKGQGEWAIGTGFAF
jgi:outer membrane protein assembly factor BamA